MPVKGRPNTFAYLHLAPDPEQAKGLMASGVAAVAYELLLLKMVLCLYLLQ